MAVRAANRMAKLKELMNLHMTSANDAFRFVSVTLVPHSKFEIAKALLLFLSKIGRFKYPRFEFLLCY